MLQHFSQVASRAWRLTSVLVAVGITSCGQPAVTNEADRNADAPTAAESSAVTATRPSVVATTSVICDLAQQIAQETIALTCLLEPGQDPHTYTPTPSDRRAIEDAALILSDGYNVAPNIDKLINATTSPATKVSVFEAAVPNPLMGNMHDHDHAETEADAHDHAPDHDHVEEEAADAQDHEHAEEEVATTEGDTETDGDQVPDPHVWHNAQNGVAIVEVIQENLSTVAPEQAAFYQQNATEISQQLTNVDTWIKQQVATIPVESRKLVTTHDAFRYYAEAYGFSVAGALEGLSTDEQVSAGRLTDLVDTVKAANVPAIFAENTTNPDRIESVARSANIKVAPQPLFVEGPGGTGTPAETYQDMLIANTCTIVNALGGTCDLENAPVGDGQ